MWISVQDAVYSVDNCAIFITRFKEEYCIDLSPYSLNAGSYVLKKYSNEQDARDALNKIIDWLSMPRSEVFSL